ncbi:MAG: hypothetical protein ACRC2B_08670 [Rubrivivax sp.]
MQALFPDIPGKETPIEQDAGQGRRGRRKVAPGQGGTQATHESAGPAKGGGAVAGRQAGTAPGNAFIFAPAHSDPGTGADHKPLH